MSFAVSFHVYYTKHFQQSHETGLAFLVRGCAVCLSWGLWNEDIDFSDWLCYSVTRYLRRAPPLTGVCRNTTVPSRGIIMTATFCSAARQRLDRRLTSPVFSAPQIYRMTVPLILDSLSVMFINMLITALISSAGESSIAAVNLVSPLLGQIGRAHV